ncbi:MAG TPA: hypothetical protein VNX88_16800 [Terriglobales bacterium]|jgi:hypothetical protein|nr:hypothetical protein [Terriglobales bacterium]
MAEVTEQSVQDAPGQQKSVEIYLDGLLVMSPSRRLTGRQIRELGAQDRVDGFETQEVNAQGKKIRTIGDSEETELHKDERFRTVPNHGGPGAAL